MQHEPDPEAAPPTIKWPPCFARVLLAIDGLRSTRFCRLSCHHRGDRRGHSRRALLSPRRALRFEVKCPVPQSSDSEHTKQKLQLWEKNIFQLWKKPYFVMECTVKPNVCGSSQRLGPASPTVREVRGGLSTGAKWGFPLDAGVGENSVFQESQTLLALWP